MVFVHMGKNEELSFQRMVTDKNVNEVIQDLESEHGKPLKTDKGDYSIRLTYDDRCFYVTKM